MLGFFGLAWVLMSVLRGLPGIGFLFRGFFAFWFVLIGLSLVLERTTRALSTRRKLESEVRSLGNVESPHNQGKLGSLLLAKGRSRRALEHLERAAAGEPQVAEWHYRLGRALLEERRPEQAVAALERAEALDPEHAYGGVQLSLAEGHQALGQAEQALQHLLTFERNHGPNPESAFRRGQALRAAGQREQARAAFSEVGALARSGPRYQSRDHAKWSLRALLARLV